MHWFYVGCAVAAVIITAVAVTPAAALVAVAVTWPLAVEA